MVRDATKMKTFVSCTVNTPLSDLPLSRIGIYEMTRSDTTSRSMESFRKLSACESSEPLEG
jgi:hypothetical protein